MPLPEKRERAPRETMGQEAYRLLLNAIVNGELAPGELLNDKALGEQLGISRTPIREAMRRLAEDRLVEMVPNKYTRVAQADEVTVLKAANALALMCELAIIQGVPRLTDASRAELTAALAPIEAAARDNDLAEQTQRAADYFRVLMRESGNALQLQLSDVLFPRAARSLAPRESFSGAEAVVAGFRALHSAALGGDVDAALAAWRQSSAAGWAAYRAVVSTPTAAVR